MSGGWRAGSDVRRRAKTSHARSRGAGRRRQGQRSEADGEGRQQTGSSRIATTYEPVQPTNAQSSAQPLRPAGSDRGPRKPTLDEMTVLVRGDEVVISRRA